jgi:hypothetical protein
MPKIHTRPACRLSVLLARDAPLGVIFRRSPARLTQLILWHTDTDTFEPGDRHIGTLYTERSDLSPDGKLLIYFAANYTARRRNKGLPDTWTALSKPPWLTPLALWPNFGTYYGGGLFTSNTQVQVNWCPPPVPTEISWAKGAPPDDLDFRYDRLFWDHENQIYSRLMRHGWKLSESFGTHTDIVFEKVNPTRPFILRQMFYRHAATFEVQDRQRKVATPLTGAFWADWDQQGRLVYAQEGKLFTANLVVSGQLDPQEIADFTPLDKKRVLAPKSAGEW